ncbi:MAG: site-2 protease family protein [Chromatiaceae bacterium]|nr:site-2 protease family protein [Chromatiaceae bacterium]
MDVLIHHLQSLALLAVPVLLAITVHEAAHGWVASRLGDPTALRLGRVSFNPLRHVDPVGTLLVPALTYVFGGLLFGWARPVPVNWRNLGHPRRDMALVALAGPGVNLLMALGWGLLLESAPLWAGAGGGLGGLLLGMAAAGVLINVFLMALNLVPLLPLDGGRVLHALLPLPLARAFARLEPFGLVLLLALLLSGLLGGVLLPLVRALVALLPGGALVASLFSV